MAENILGILFVTSTSRGRNVFRYPPDPLSPYPRLSQPIYPSATFTARDNVFGDVRRRKLFPDGSTLASNSASASAAAGRRKSSQISIPSYGTRRSGSNQLGRPFGESSDGGRGGGGSYPNRRYSGSGRVDVQGFEMRDDDEEDEDGSGDSDDDLYFMGVNRVPLSGKRLADEVINARHDDHTHGQLRKGDQTGANTLLNAQGQASEGKNRSPQGDPGGKTGISGGVPLNGAPGAKYDASIDSQYSYALGYSLDFLSDMLTPPRAACNRRFELCVDELCFIGHPVTIGADGQWDYPKEQTEGYSAPRRGFGTEEGERRGRRREAVGHSHLRTVVEGSGSEGTPETEKRDPLGSPSRNKRTDGGASGAGLSGSRTMGENGDDCPTLNMFHMVLIIDKPDPQTGTSGGTDHIAPSEGYEEMYREIAFKWTAAAYALQVKDNWVARESWEMAKGRERAMAEGISVEKCCLSMYRTNPLERALQDLAYNLWLFRTSPVNPLYTHLPTTLTVHLADLPISMILSPHSSTTDESWAHWGSSGHEHDLDADSEASSDSGGVSDLLGGGGGRERQGREMRVEPWQTLLLVEDRAKERAKEVASAVVGLGSWTPTQSGFPSDGERDRDSGSPAYTAGLGLGSRRGSKETQVEEDESNLMKALIEACDVSKPLADIAHLLRFDLDGIVVPLARELVQNKKAILIDVINVRLRTLVMLSTIVEHNTSLEEYITSFGRLFPSLPPLPVFLSQISAAPTPFRDIMPTDLTESDSVPRQIYLDSLIWLLKHDLVMQVHTHVRIWARAEVKEIAWRRLWQRRRARWVASRSGSTRESSRSSATSTLGDGDGDGDDGITPRADRSNPIDGTTTSSAAMTRTQTPGDTRPTTTRSSSFNNINLGQSFMDYDPELEMDSDVGEADLDRLETMNFSLDQKEPARADMPKFEGSFILRPARAVKEEMRWLRVIREGADEVWASKFDLCVQYFDGATSFEEISYRTGLRMREIDWIVKLFKEDVVVLLHP